MPELSRRAVLRSGAALSVASFAAITPMARAEALFGYYSDATSDEALAALAPRERLLMDFGWKFLQGNAANPAKDLGFGADQGAFSKSGSFDFAKVEIGDKHERYDDSKWRSLDLPHDWAVELPFVHDDTLQSHGYKPLGRNYPETSVGWYRKTFDLPSEDAGRRITIDLDGAFRSALVFLNGYFIGRNDNGYAPFSFDVSDYLVYGATNALVVRMDASFGDGWFYEGAGIYRHVWLTKTDPLHLGQWESYVRADLKGRMATLSLGTAVLNHGPASAEASVHWKVLDATGKTVATAEAAHQTIAKDGQAAFNATARLADPALWSPEAPNLYTAIITVESAGKAIDAEQVNFGVRTILFDAYKGFFLNGKSTKIKGTCNHHDHAGVGAALPDRLQWYRLGVLKEMGSNAVRTSHNMPTPEWVDACDRMGMMMMCETRNEASTPEGLGKLCTSSATSA